MRYQYFTVDVFSGQRFGGNQLAVLPEADGLSAELMAKIAVEFNYAETTFVLPPEDTANTRRVRIFTPGGEIPFAGHPNVGTAFVLAARGDIAPEGGEARVIFEEEAGLVAVTIRFADGQPQSCELTAPQPLSLGAEYPAVDVAECVGLAETDIVCDVHGPVLASVGLPFLCVELRDWRALGRSLVRADRLAELLPSDAATGIHLYTRKVGDMDVDARARMYAPLVGVPEDPATGSANCALAGLLAQLSGEASGTFTWRIAQGIEMGRASLLDATAHKRDGQVLELRIGGACVPVAEGWIQVA
jgi:trans-2,3-dihydro-3-hydroxyanthranilate isomerase